MFGGRRKELSDPEVKQTPVVMSAVVELKREDHAKALHAKTARPEP